MKRLKTWLCKMFGHSFSAVDLLMFRVECEGRCFTVDKLTGEQRPFTQIPEIECRRCGRRFWPKQKARVRPAPEKESAFRG